MQAPPFRRSRTTHHAPPHLGWLLAPLVALHLSDAAFAAPAHGEGGVAIGALPGEVHAVWGEPQERVEYEVKREVVWHYPTQSVTFFEGRVVRYGPYTLSDVDQPAPQPSVAPVPPQVGRSASPKTQEKRSRRPSAARTPHILRDQEFVESLLSLSDEAPASDANDQRRGRRPLRPIREAD